MLSCLWTVAHVTRNLVAITESHRSALRWKIAGMPPQCIPRRNLTKSGPNGLIPVVSAHVRSVARHAPRSMGHRRHISGCKRQLRSYVFL